MFSFHFVKKKLAVLTRNALLLCLVDQKLLLRGCSFERKPISLLSACSLQQMYPHASGLQKKSEVIFY